MRMFSLVLLDFSSDTISTACEWWPIMPCMNLTSAAVCCTRDRSTAFSAEMTRVDSPGAPGCTIGGADPAPAVPTLAVRHDAPAATIRRTAPIRREYPFKICKGYTVGGAAINETGAGPGL